MSITIDNYSDKSFVVRGTTRDQKETIDALKAMGGRYNANLRDSAGWIFSHTKRSDVESYINTGILPIKLLTGKKSDPQTHESIKLALSKPTDSPELYGDNYQRVIYSVVKPNLNSRARVILGFDVTEYPVVKLESSSPGIIDEVEVGDSKMKIGLVSGKWKIIGEGRPHSVEFLF